MLKIYGTFAFLTNFREVGKFLSIGVFLCFLWEKETCYGQFPKSSVTNFYKVTHIQIEKYPRKAEDVNVKPIPITPIAFLSSLAMFTNDKLLLIPMFIFLACLPPLCNISRG